MEHKSFWSKLRRAAAAGLALAAAVLGIWVIGWQLLGSAPSWLRALASLAFLLGVLLFVLSFSPDLGVTLRWALRVPGFTLAVGVVALSWFCESGRCMSPQLAVDLPPQVVPGSLQVALRTDDDWKWDLSTWDCIWTVEGIRQPPRKCDQPLQVYIDAQLHGQEITFTVDATDELGRPQAASPTTATIAAFSIDLRPRIPIAERDAIAQVTIRGEPLDDSFQCDWAFPVRTDTNDAVATPSPDGCEMSFRPARADDFGDYEARIEVAVRGEQGSPVTVRGDFNVNHPQTFGMIVLDSSERMEYPLTDHDDASAMPPTTLEVAKSLVLSRLQGLGGVRGSRTGVQVFGSDPDPRDPCTSTELLIELWASTPNAEDLVIALEPGHYYAPLEPAVHAALEELRATPLRVQAGAASYYLIVVTGGPDNCRWVGLGAILRTLEPGGIIDSLIVEGHLLGVEIALAVEVGSFEMFESLNPERQVPPGHVLIIVEDRGEAERVLRVVDRLLRPEFAQEACQDLLSVVREKQKEFEDMFFEVDIGLRNLQTHCAALDFSNEAP